MRLVPSAWIWVTLLGLTRIALPAAPAVPAEFEKAAAVVLSESARWNIVPLRYADFEVSERVLIQDPRGFSEADRAIFYDSKRQKIQDFRARTIQPNGAIVEIPQDLIHDVVAFKTDEVEYHSLQFTFLAVRPGSVLELKYRIHEREPSGARTWEPQRAIPVLESSFRISVRQPAHVVPIQIYTVGRGIGGQSCEAPDTKRGSRSRRFGMICRDLPPLELDEQAPPERDVRIRLDVSWGAENLIVERWQYLARRWSDAIGRFTRSCGDCEQLSRDLVRGATDDREKVDRIVEWVKQNLEFRPPPLFSGMGGPALHYASAGEVLENRGGWPNEITLLTLALLRGAGIQSGPLLVADRSEGRFHYDAMDAAGHLMLEAMIGGARSVVDPSCRYCEPGTTDWRYSSDKGYVGVRLARASGAPVAIGTIPAVHNALRRTERIRFTDEGAARVSGTASWSGQFSVDQRERWAEMTENERREDFFAYLAGAIDDPELTTTDPEDLFRTLTAEYEFESSAIVLPDGRMLIHPLDLFSDRLAIPIQEQRESPLWFRFPFSIEAETIFELPAGRRVQLPEEPVELSGPGMTFRYHWSSGRRAGEVVWRGSLTVRTVEVSSEEYSEARRFIRELRHLFRGGIVATQRGDRVSEASE